MASLPIAVQSKAAMQAAFTVTPSRVVTPQSSSVVGVPKAGAFEWQQIFVSWGWQNV